VPPTAQGAGNGLSEPLTSQIGVIAVIVNDVQICVDVEYGQYRVLHWAVGRLVMSRQISTGRTTLRTIETTNNLGAPLAEPEIEDLQRRLGVSLPSDYVAFLSEHNGGSPKPNVFPIRGFGLDNQGVLAFFFGVKHGEFVDLENMARESRGIRMPPEFLPVAFDVFGNLICLTISGPATGKVYWWWHEEEADEGEPPTYDNIYFVANSFTELLDNLVELPEELDE